MVIVNAMGESCPIPVIKTRKAIKELTGAETIKVLVDNEIAVQNVVKMAASMGGKAVSEQIGDKEFQVVIQIESAEDDACGSDISIENNAVIVVSSDRMGIGNDDLGKVLLKGFIFAVTQLEQLPSAMLFYNGGATLTAEGSDSLEDLKNLEGQGVEILTCGTCLNYYNLAEKLQVGTVTNMYSIVEKMTAASKIIQP